ncbi:conserved hypothetical protein [Verticillium alfalfae VaMs.102]|uniref:Uncharacterized protein n=1 Tax=Verticillium alfalfae (strain VaMs.102 / ATCC MYA-4576 / FGSC 10136) TaxID=526221 RepID=C9SVF5_VERA1|nr:conserved hypothetical protein [Verticillium alfalfae VaMs.102]EEY22770.1 conserved hypothetical protein [Verticillium alfalfae VaMs.102]
MNYAHDPRSRYAANGPVASYNDSMGAGKSGSRDDSSIPQPRTIQPTPRPQSAYLTSAPMQMTFAQAAAMRPAPDRYRRPSIQQQQVRQHSAGPSGSGMAAVGHHYSPHGTTDRTNAPVVGSRRPAANNRPSSYYNPADDLQLNRQAAEDAKRPRRRSVHTLDSADQPKSSAPQEVAPTQERIPTPKNGKNGEQKSLRLVPGEASTHIRNGSSESLASSRSSHSRPTSSANRNVPAPTGNPSSLSITSNPDEGSMKQDQPKLVNIPPRNSSSDASKRTLNPSPLSRPVTMGDTAAQNTASSSGETPQQSATNMSSPAAQHLAAINQKGARSKSKTSRLRRAFSFGSAADFKKAAEPSGEVTADAAAATDKTEPSRLHKEPNADEIYDAEQAAIAKKQEEGGLGNSIYGGRFFTGSTDNLSVSSTASSASIMIRKMGRGMKKSTRSLVGLFRPKSVVGVPAADGPLMPEAARRPSWSLNESGWEVPAQTTLAIARALLGGDRERAEVLAAVRKGILKHNAGAASPAREKGAPFELPAIPTVSDSPYRAPPARPMMNAGHKRTGLIFHDTWPSGEYDRRGDIATCNRLTPMLAQQIKEELNSFKMHDEEILSAFCFLMRGSEPDSCIRTHFIPSKRRGKHREFWIKDVVWPVMSEERLTVSNMWRRLEHARRGPEDGLSEAEQTHKTRVRGGQHSIHTLS